MVFQQPPSRALKKCSTSPAARSIQQNRHEHNINTGVRGSRPNSQVPGPRTGIIAHDHSVAGKAGKTRLRSIKFGIDGGEGRFAFGSDTEIGELRYVRAGLYRGLRPPRSHDARNGNAAQVHTRIYHFQLVCPIQNCAEFFDDALQSPFCRHRHLGGTIV